MIDELLQRLSGTPAGKMAGEALSSVDWDGVHRRSQASFDRVRNAGSSLALESGMVPTPPAAPYQAGDFQRSGPQMRPVGVGETMRDTFLPQRDEQGIPKPMGAADILNAALWIAPGFKGLKTQAPSAAPATGGGIRAYHGSPHDFDRFDMSKIGTGEGFQSYGHGLYFAENEGVAKQYRDTLAPHKANAEISKARTALSDLELEMVEETRRRGIPFKNGDQHGWGDFEALVPDAIRKEFAPTILQLESRLKAATEADKTGRMYEVNINANPEQMLDWDMPLSGQAPGVAENLRSIVKLGDRAPADWIAHSPGAESRMRDAGIPGIKYLDEGSRVIPALEQSIARRQDGIKNNPRANDADYKSLEDAKARLAAMPKPTSNYVMFDDKLIDILRKYGLAGVLPAGAATMSNNDAKAAQ